MNKEEIYKFNDFVISYDKGFKDRSVLIISKINKINICILGELYDESADIVNTIINNLQQENKQLKEELKYTVPIVKHNKIVRKRLKENKKYKEVIDKAIEYLTSYSSIHTIQFGTENDSLNDIELNKTLDEKTLNEMTNRYLKVHDKLLEILKEVE